MYDRDEMSFNTVKISTLAQKEKEKGNSCIIITIHCFLTFHNQEYED